MAHAMGILRVLHHIRGMVQSFKHEALAGERRQAMDHFHRLLHLNSGDDGRDRRRRGDLALRCPFIREQVARHAPLQKRPTGLSQCALVARGTTRQEHSSHAVDPFDSSIDPWPVRLPCGSIYPQTSFSIIQARDDHITPSEQSKATIEDYVPDQWTNPGRAQQGANPLYGRFRLVLSDLIIAKKHRARQVRSLDAIEIHHYNLLETD